MTKSGKIKAPGFCATIVKTSVSQVNGVGFSIDSYGSEVIAFAIAKVQRTHRLTFGFDFYGSRNNKTAGQFHLERVVFLMNRMDKMKYREIAEATGIGIKAVEKRISQALKLLKQEIQD